MHHPIWRMIAVVLLAALVFGAARYLDNNPRRVVVEQPQNHAEETVMATEALSTEPQETVPVQTTVPLETEPQEERFLLTFVGDCTLGANPSNSLANTGFIKTVGDDYGYPFRNVITWFENDECTFLNLEGPLTDSKNAVQKEHVFR